MDACVDGMVARSVVDGQINSRVRAAARLYNPLGSQYRLRSRARQASALASAS